MISGTFFKNSNILAYFLNIRLTKVMKIVLQLVFVWRKPTEQHFYLHAIIEENLHVWSRKTSIGLLTFTI